MKTRKAYQYLMFLMFFLTCVINAPLLVGAQQLPDISVAPLNPEFFSYIDSPKAVYLLQQPSEHGLGLIPSPVDLSHLQVATLLQGSVVLSLPSSYDLRTQGRLTPVRNQGGCGSCWTFGTYGSLESNLMPSETSDFSENNLNNTHGFDLAPCAGGNADMSTAYLARWDGPVNESDDPYNPGGVILSGLSERKHVQEVLFIPDRGGPSDNSNIKQAVMDYGAVYTSMCYSDASYLSGNHAYYFTGSLCPPSTTQRTNHAVTIVGWDDNFPGSNFKTAPPGNGAFIIRNSWGTGWGENGYFYVSYYDSQIGQENRIFNNAESTSNYGQIYQYDPLGWTANMGYSSNTAWFSNVFNADSNDPLGAVGFYTASMNSAYELYIYTNVNSPPRGGFLAASKTGTIPSAGYHTIPLDALVPLTSGQDFSVVVKLTTPGYTHPIAIEHPLQGYSSAATAHLGESYISANGTTWEDLTLVLINGNPIFANTNVCVKAFTFLSLPGGIASASAPAVAWNSTAGQFQIAVRDPGTNRIYVGTANANGSFNNDWRRLPTGTTSTAPAIAWNPGTNKVQIATKGNTSNNLFVGSYNADGTGLSSWTLIAANSLSAPAVAWNSAAGKLQIAIRGNNNRINVGTVNGDGIGFSGWTQLPTGTTSVAPAIAWSPTASKVLIVTKGNATNNLFLARFDAAGTGLSSWTLLTGKTSAAPAIAWNNLTSRLQIVTKGNLTNNIFACNVKADGTDQIIWTQVPGGVSTDSPAIAINPALATLNVFARDAPGNLYEYVTVP